jgi:hypothetical protein
MERDVGLEIDHGEQDAQNDNQALTEDSADSVAHIARQTHD